MKIQISGKLLSLPQVNPQTGDYVIEGVERVQFEVPQADQITVERDNDLNETRVLHDGECYLSV